MRSRAAGKIDFKDEIVLQVTGKVIYVDFVLISMVKAVDLWYDTYYQIDPWGVTKKAHIIHLIRFYDRSKFSDHNTIGIERDRYLEDISLYIQMKRDD